MMTRLFLSAACAFGLAMPAAAQSFEAENKLTVNPVQGGFEVIESGSFGARSIWCAASDYAQDVLGAPGTTRLYVLSPRGAAQTQPGRIGVTFTTDASAVSPAATLIVSTGLRTPGANLSVDHSYQFCYDRRLINTGL